MVLLLLSGVNSENGFLDDGHTRARLFWTQERRFMNELFRTKNETWKKIQSNLLFIAAAELLIYNGGLMIKYPVSEMINFFHLLQGRTTRYTIMRISG